MKAMAYQRYGTLDATQRPCLAGCGYDHAVAAEDLVGVSPRRERGSVGVLPYGPSPRNASSRRGQDGARWSGS